MPHTVNLPPEIGGFTFNGVHSSFYGVRQTPGSRVLSPKKNRTLIRIPGRSEAIVVDQDSYELRVESINCSYITQHGVSLQRQVRLIAGWLNASVAELSFDYEPEMRYKAFLSNAPPTVKQLEFAMFDLEFTMVNPFAYEDAEVVLTTDKTISLPVAGTVETPGVCRIKNVGTSPLTKIKLSIRRITN